jgi:hypothetical protein
MAIILVATNLRIPNRTMVQSRSGTIHPFTGGS